MGEEIHEDRTVLMNCSVHYEDSEYWEDIAMISGFPKPRSFSCTKTEKQKSTNTLWHKVRFCTTSPQEFFVGHGKTVGSIWKLTEHVICITTFLIFSEK